MTIRLGEEASAECRCDAYGQGCEPTVLICGTFDLAERNTHPLLSLMPPLLLIRSSAGRSLEWLHPTLRFFAAEALRQGPGSQRMQTAARLLSEEQLHLTEMAAQVGYDSEAAFSKAFKRTLGVSPSIYRQGKV